MKSSQASLPEVESQAHGQDVAPSRGGHAISTRDPWWMASLIVAGLGLVDSLYLAWIKITQQTALCSNIGDCDTVNNSVYSEIAGIPIALLGAGAYLAILGTLYLERRPGFWKANGTTIVFGLALVGVLYSAYLTYIEIAVLRAICPYCVVSAIALVALLVFSIVRLVQAEPEEIY